MRRPRALGAFARLPLDFAHRPGEFAVAMNMQIFVINLAKDVERREHITRQLDELALDYEIVPGIVGADLSPEDCLRHYDDGKAKWRQSRSLVPAEIGCALSHLKVYREIDARGIDCALVLEDDVVLPPDLAQFLSDCAAILDFARPEVWLLSPASARKGVAGRELLRSGRVVFPFHSGVYASSYVLTAMAARALIGELYPVGDVADCWSRLQRYGIVDLSVATPPLIEQDQEQFGSSTTADLRRRVGRDFVTWFVYKVRRTRSVIWEVLYAPYRRLTRHKPTYRTSGRQ